MPSGYRPKPYQAPRIEIGERQNRAWKTVRPNLLSVGDTLANNGLIEKIETHQSSTHVILKNGNTLYIGHGEYVLAFIADQKEE